MPSLLAALLRTARTSARHTLARPSFARTAAMAIVAGGLIAATAHLRPASAEEPKIADKVFSADQKKAIEEVIKDYLVNNPEVFLEVQQALEAKMDKIQAEKLKTALSENAKDIYRDPDGAVAGNPNGNITVVEFFDYNCGYCKKSFADIAKLIAVDPNIRVVFKELPILAKASEEASKIALAARLQGKYWEMHKAIFESKAPANEANSLKLAEKLGLDMTRLKADMNGPAVKTELDKTKQLANKMGINGTPHFLVGDRAIPGAPENLLDLIKTNAAELRKTGCPVC